MSLQLPSPEQARRSQELLPYIKNLGRIPDGRESDRKAILAELADTMGEEKALLAMAELVWTLIGAYTASAQDLDKCNGGPVRADGRVVSDVFLILETIYEGIISGRLPS